MINASLQFGFYIRNSNAYLPDFVVLVDFGSGVIFVILVPFYMKFIRMKLNPFMVLKNLLNQ